jgi:UDP-glucose 4-epimerase
MSPYAIDKLTCEKYVSVLSQAWNMGYSVLRFFNIFGPRQSGTSDYAGVVHIFADAALAKRGVVVYGDGKQTRDFVFVHDVARIIADAIERPELVGRTVNVGTGNPTSLHDLIAALEKILGHALTVGYRPQRVGDIRHSAADVRLLRMLLGQTPTTTIEAGLRELVKSLVADSEKKANYT